MNTLIALLLILMLVSAYDLRTPEPPPVPTLPERFFQGYLGWDIIQTTAFCSGLLLLAVAVLWFVGSVTGYSKGTVLGEIEKGNEGKQIKIERNFFGGLLVVVGIMFVVSLGLLVTGWTW